MTEILLQGQNGSYKFDPRNPESRIADGGMGVVYLGIQVETGKKVAIKVIYRELAQDEKNIERARREAAIKVNHPNLIKMYDFVEKDGIYHIISEYLEGQNLEEFIKQNPNINTAYAIRIINEVLNGLQALHSQNPPIIHRDIKPSNIFLCYDGTVKLMDFGIARITGGERKSLTGMGTVVGSPHYSPPEQVRGEINKINETTDIYAIGITFYELLTGNPPFDATNEFDILKKQVDEPLPENNKIRKELFRVLVKATEKKQDARYKSIEQLRKELSKFGNSDKEKKNNKNDAKNVKPVTIIKKNRGWKFIGILFILLIIGEFITYLYYEEHPYDIEEFAIEHFSWYRKLENKNYDLSNQLSEVQNRINELQNKNNEPQNYIKIKHFPSSLLGNWYTDVNNIWNVYIFKKNGNIIIRTGNRFYDIIRIYRNYYDQKLYKIISIRNNFYYSINIRIESDSQMLFSKSTSFNRLSEALEYRAISYSGHHKN